MDYIENKTFDEIKVGDSASLVRTLTPEDVKLFAVMSGNVNPTHVDEEYARSDIFHKIIAHGMWSGALISTLLGTKLPGPGTIYVGQTLKFMTPVALGDTVTVSVTVAGKDPETHRVTFDCRCTNQKDERVISGTAQVTAPTDKIKRPRALLPEVHLHEPGARFRQLIGRTKGLAPIRMAVVHPVDGNSLRGAVDAAQADLITPLLVGPEGKIRAAAIAEGIDLSPYELVPTSHSHEAAAMAVALAHAGKVEALMKGSLHTDELMHEVVAQDTGLRTGRRMSHVFVMDAPEYPRLLFLTDAAINIAPDLECQTRHRPERDRPRARAGDRNPQSGDPCGRRDGDSKATVHTGGSGSLQDGRPPADHGGRDGRPARFRQRGFGGGGQGQGHHFAGGRPGRHPRGPGPRIRQHAGETAGVSGRGTAGRYRTRRACPLP